MVRSSGIILPISSLPSPYGIGTLGASAHEFVDFLAAAGQSWWQILPVGPTSFGDSPYQSPSTYAGNPYFIDLDLLVEDGLLEQDEVDALPWGTDPSRVDYRLIYENRLPLLRKATERGWKRDAAEVEGDVLADQTKVGAGRQPRPVGENDGLGPAVDLQPQRGRRDGEEPESARGAGAEGRSRHEDS